jgi:hypothetical protein
MRTGSTVKKSNRRVVVFLSLVSVLTLTSALLLALAPAPLRPDSSNSLFALDTPEAMDAVFQTRISPKATRWKYIYVHHSRLPNGNALTQGNQPGGLSDHFVIGNGDGAIDGEIQIGQRWNQQDSANPPAGASQIDPNCISICLVGDFDHAVPTATQLRRLTQLVNALQGRFDIPAGQVLLLNQADSQAGMGRYFPATAFREQLLP